MKGPVRTSGPRRERFDAVVVGAGPNGLAAAITLARARRSVCVIEAASTVGGGCRSAELTLTGFLHDACSAVFPLGAGSPVLSRLPLERYGLRWIESEVQIAHPLPDGTALVMRDPEATAERLGADAGAYLRLVGPVVRDWRVIIDDLVGPLHVPLDPRKAAAAVRFASRAVLPATVLARRFRTPAARALLAGCAAHSILALSEPLTGAFALIMLASAHAVGWPVAAGGARTLSAALAAHLLELGGEIVTGRPITSLDALPPHRAALLDLTPRQVAEVAGRRLEGGWRGRAYLRRLRRFRYGPGAFKLDLALDGPVPWRDPEVLRAATVHVGGRFEDVAAAEAAVAEGAIPARPAELLGGKVVVKDGVVWSATP
ncbi:MAG: phytoene desaturase family protein [Gemmatimonadaceae bacterium]